MTRQGPGQKAQDVRPPAPAPSVPVAGQLGPPPRRAVAGLCQVRAKAGMQGARFSHRKRGAETKFQNNPQEKSGPVWRAKRLTFVPSFPARPGSPCSPGGPGGPGWPRSPIGPVSPVGPCRENRVSHKFRGAHGVTCLNLRTALATGVKGHRVATTLRGAWQVSFW